MYNLLIVDDEKIIRDGIYELLSMEDSLELNLFSASSAIEAEQVLEERKIDIVLTDIRMPRMSGIELFDVIQERWPHCRVIFLTGYSEFDYVYKVQKHARYILKAEEDEKIITAVAEAIEEIENDLLVQEGTTLLVQRQELERNRFLYDLFSGFIDISTITGTLISSLGIDLEISREMYYAVMRHETIVSESYDEQIRILGDMQLLLDKYFFDFMDGAAFHYTRNYIVLLLQPKKWESVEKNILTMKGKSELFQRACFKNFGMAVSVLIGSRPLPVGEILEDFPSVKARLLLAGDEALLVRLDPEEQENRSEQTDSQQRNIISSRLELLDYYFENSNREHVAALLNEAIDLFDGTASMDDLFAVEIYSDVSLRLVRFMNQFQLSEEVFKRIEARKLYRVGMHGSWPEAFRYLIDVSELVFEMKQAGQVRSNDDVIDRVKAYIHENLSGDTSLDALSDLVELSPEYLLRLFKKSEGVTILQYINDLKIIKAKRLITDREKQVKEIAFELGFSSSGYFGRFFKSKTGLSPQVYREQMESR